MNFPVFPWGKNEVKGTSAHLPWYSCQLQFVSSFNEEKKPFPSTIPPQWQRQAEPRNVSC